MIRLALTLGAALFPASAVTAQDLLPSPPLAPDVAALPRLAGEGAIIARVNAALAQRDQRDLDAVTCYGGQPDGPFRTVEVFADGPEFLSLVISTSSYCEGAAHPWWHQDILNFDLETGEQTDLRAYMPTAFGSNPEDALAVLFLNTVADLPGDCVQSYARAFRDGYLRFDLGLAEAEGALMIWPGGLAYVETPCLDLAYVPLARLQEAGFHGTLIRALSPTP